MNLRCIVRLAFIIPWTVGMFAVRFMAKPVAAVSRRTEQAVRRGLFRFWARGMCLALGVRTEVHGEHPPGGFVQVSNHLSFLDIIILAKELGCVFVSMDDVLSWPFLGFIIKEMNTIFVNREARMDTTRVADEITRALEEGYSVHLFAEGGVSTYGDVRPFKPALLEPAVRLGLSVHYVTIGYGTGESDPPPSESVLWPEDLGFGAYAIRLLRLRRIRARLTFGETSVKRDDRKELAQALHDEVARVFQPLE